jgi:hypothetical protein
MNAEGGRWKMRFPLDAQLSTLDFSKKGGTTMREHERHHEDIREPQPGAGVPMDQGAQLRAQMERLLAQGADEIERALSGDSTAFLDANRQEGGQ